MQSWVSPLKIYFNSIIMYIDCVISRLFLSYLCYNFASVISRHVFQCIYCELFLCKCFVAKCAIPHDICEVAMQFDNKDLFGTAEIRLFFFRKLSGITVYRKRLNSNHFIFLFSKLIWLN